MLDFSPCLALRLLLAPPEPDFELLEAAALARLLLLAGELDLPSLEIELADEDLDGEDLEDEELLRDAMVMLLGLDL